MERFGFYMLLLYLGNVLVDDLYAPFVPTFIVDPEVDDHIWDCAHVLMVSESAHIDCSLLAVRPMDLRSYPGRPFDTPDQIEYLHAIKAQLSTSSHAYIRVLRLLYDLITETGYAVYCILKTHLTALLVSVTSMPSQRSAPLSSRNLNSSVT